MLCLEWPIPSYSHMVWLDGGSLSVVVTLSYGEPQETSMCQCPRLPDRAPLYDIFIAGHIWNNLELAAQHWSLEVWLRVSGRGSVGGDGMVRDSCTV